jgi:predicted SAM-dependent methyltransferase
MVKLHLGCGTKHIDGYTNIDVRYLPGVDEVNNIKFLRNYKPNSVDLIYACHVLEHFSRWEYKTVLTRWFELLKPGGTLRLAIPNFSAICSYYVKTGDLSSIMGLLYGGQDYDENYHYVTFDYDSLSNDLIQIGFNNIIAYDYKTTEHSDVDDFSKAYLPHLDKNGILMSLNIEAKK